MLKKKNKDGTPDKRFTANKPPKAKATDNPQTDVVTTTPGTNINYVQIAEDPNELHAQLLKENNLKLDFDVLEGTISTKYGIIKLEKPTLVVKAEYVGRK